MVIEKHVTIALGELGQSEIPGDEDNPRISEYLKSVNQGSDDEIPWCGAFINWCLEKAGYSGTKSGLAKSYLNWGYKIDTPILGAIAVFDRGKYKWQGHVGIYLDEDKYYIYIISGNVDNKVCIRAMSKSKLIEYRWSSEFI